MSAQAAAALLVLGIATHAHAFVAPAQCSRALGLWSRAAPLLRICPVAARPSRANWAVMQLDNRRDEGETGDTSFYSLKQRILPSPEQIKSNVLEGTLGQRGELYVGLQFGLVFLVIIAPAFSEWLESGGLVAGLAVCATGLALGYGGVRQLGDSLSPWPKPIGREPPFTPPCCYALVQCSARKRAHVSVRECPRMCVYIPACVYIYTCTRARTHLTAS